jgi:hypothetical protein
MVTLGGNIHWMPVKRLFRMSSMKALREKVKCLYFCFHVSVSYFGIMVGSSLKRLAVSFPAVFSVYTFVSDTTVFKSPASYLLGATVLFIW